jgi:Na+/proline symporter
MAAGFLTAVLWTVGLKERFFDLYEMIPGFAAGLGATVAVSLLTRPPEGADAELESVARAIEER